MKYKINNNDINNSATKDIVDQNKYKKIKTGSNSIYTINVKKNKKKRILLFSLYLLAFGSTTVTTITILLLHTNAAFNNSQFNPDSNNKLWDDYYQKHHRDSAPISLDSTIDYFNKSTNIITFNVIKNPADNGNIDFTSVLNSIDNNLQKAKIESDIDNDNSSLLPINFFLNVNYNPAVNFTIGNDKNQKTNNSFILPKGFNESNSYVLNLTTNDQAPTFGIKNTKVNIQINIKIINQVAINIASLPFNFPDKIINISNPENATIDSIKDKWLIPTIEDQFAITLSKTLNVAKTEIKPSYYKIVFDDSTTKKDFTKNVAVQFSITSLDNNPWNFTGTTKDCTINVKNYIADLSTMKELTNEIEAQYNNDKDNKNFQITLDNQKDENADVSLSEDNLKFVNEQIIKGVQTICQNYFQKNYSDLNIENSDYITSTNLKVGDNIFNNKLGKPIEIKIIASKNDHKLTNSLDKINAIVHGHNKNNISDSFSLAPFALDGIWLKDCKDANILQEGQHFYEQNKLLENWITGKDSLLNKINNNSYQPVVNSFTGKFTMNYLLDGEKTPSGMSVDISKDITGGNATNFWDLITKTKSIFLETDVAVTSSWALNNVKLIFTDSETQPTKDNTLYTLDLSDKFKGVTVSDRATLTFPDFNFNFNYQLVS